jgi:hypothetical protein
MDRKEESKVYKKLTELWDSGNKNKNSIIIGLSGVPVCLLLCELLPITVKEMYAEVKELYKIKAVDSNYDLESLNLDDEDDKKEFFRNFTLVPK